mgnify:FL=1
MLEEPGTGSPPDAVAWARITDTPLDLGEHLKAVAGPGCGAVVTFVGQIRDHDPGASGSVERVEYSAHPEAAAILEQIARELPGPDIRIAVSHRSGAVEVGEPALIACVASAHRAPAFEASSALIERIKSEVPIWKRQVETDGSHNWQGLT